MSVVIPPGTKFTRQELDYEGDSRKKAIDVTYTVIEQYEHFVLVENEKHSRQCISNADLIIAGIIKVETPGK
ncbi:MAG: hypothetical protein PHP50_14215 [Lachnospiraceae bacterium]|nr:hypothetical protein [Lachnospiraceae bacterium]